MSKIHFRDKCYKDVQEIADAFNWPLEYAEYKIQTFGIVDCKDCEPKKKGKEDN